MWLFECRCGRKKKAVVVPDVVDVPQALEEVPVEEPVIEESLSNVSESSYEHSIHEVAFGDDKEIDERVVKRLSELLVPYLTKDSLKALRVSYNEYVYLEESLSVSLSVEKMLEIIAEIIKKHSVNKWTSYFNGRMYVFKKRSKLLGFKKNNKKGLVVKSSIIEYHLEKDIAQHADDDKKLISIEDEFVRVPDAAK